MTMREQLTYDEWVKQYPGKEIPNCGICGQSVLDSTCEYVHQYECDECGRVGCYYCFAHNPDPASGGTCCKCATEEYKERLKEHIRKNHPKLTERFDEIFGMLQEGNILEFMSPEHDLEYLIEQGDIDDAARELRET